MKKISLLGATGSIGLQTIDILQSQKEEFQLVAFSSGRNIDKTREIIKALQPELVSVQEEHDALALQNEFPSTTFTYGNKGLVEVELSISAAQNIEGNELLTNEQTLTGITEANVKPEDKLDDYIVRTVIPSRRYNILTLQKDNFTEISRL